MTALVAIVPSRGRPGEAAELAATFCETCTADTRLVFVVDDDDPTFAGYVQAMGSDPGLVLAGPRDSTMVKALNAAAVMYAEQVPALAFMGDDHRPRTKGWDAAYIEALKDLGTGIVYGNDLLQGPRIPTQVAMTSDIVRTLGHMVPPSLIHLFADNYWKDLGVGAGCLRYLPNIIVEHMHPYAGKAPLDDGYRRVNASGMYTADAAAYAEYVSARLLGDIQKVKALR